MLYCLWAYKMNRIRTYELAFKLKKAIVCPFLHTWKHSVRGMARLAHG